jgi:acetate kinase
VDILAVNAGSSSLKLRLVSESGDVTAEGDHPPGESDALERFLHEHPAPAAAAHRFVYGGRLREPVLLDEVVLTDIAAAAELAPLHTPVAVGLARELTTLRPGLPQVACFDTGFHRTLPARAATYAVPLEWRERYGVHRNGFHGFSHAWASRRVPELLHRSPTGLRTVTCHLGAGVSLAAVRDGRSVDTTMGMTPAEGPVMAVRSGTIDPGAVLYLVEREGGPARVREVLERRSGLLALSGSGGDMRKVLAAAARGSARARLGVDVYVHRVRGAVAAMAAAMEGLDALAFTGGVGENAPQVRAAICDGLGFLGVALNPEANAGCAGDSVISPARAAVPVVVVAAREELEMAREARRLLRASEP